MNVDKIPAGMDMDELVAEKVMGWHRCAANGCPQLHPTDDCHNETVPEYSTNLADAWQVVEQLNTAGYTFGMMVFKDGTVAAGFSRTIDGMKDDFGLPRLAFGQSCTKGAPLAICRAALKAKGQEAEHAE